MVRLRRYWNDIRSSLWFVPGLLVLAAIVLAVVLVEVDTHIDPQALASWPRLFGAGVDGSRALLTAIASSMITVAGVTFSITVVALSLTSTQYTSRVLRNFMRDRANQLVLGVFVGVFAYCLVVLRTIRTGNEGAFVPSLAVLVGIVLALVGIGFLIFFIHHIASTIQASSIVAAAASETMDAIDRLFPDGLGREPENAPEEAAALVDRPWWVLRAQTTGYIEAVDADALLRFAAEQKVVVRMEHGIGEFVAAGTPLVSVTASAALVEEAEQRLNAAFAIGRQRTIEQDAGFGIRQIVDVALKALSPGVNDTTTAVICVDHLGALLGRLAGRRVESPYRLEHGELRIIARGPSFSGMLGEAFDQIRQNAAGNVAILRRLLEALTGVAHQTSQGGRLQTIREQATLVGELAARSIPCRPDREGVEAVLERLLRLLAGKQRDSAEAEAPCCAAPVSGEA